MLLFKEIKCKTIFEQLPIASLIVDYETLSIKKLNTSAAALYCYSKTEFKKLGMWDIDATESEKSLLRKIKKLKKLKEFSFKTKHVTKDKRILDVSVSVNIIKIKDKKFFNVTCHNSTNEVKVANKLSYFEKKFEFFFNQLPDAILIIDHNLEKIVNANMAASELLGYSEGELREIKFADLIHLGKETKNCKEIITDCLKNNQEFLERKIQKKDGNTIDTFVSFKKLSSPYGTNIIITSRDVTIQKQDELELKELNESLTKIIDIKAGELYENERLLLEQSKLAQMGEMLNMIAHQWRQPLNAISTAALNLSFQNELDTLEKGAVENISKFIQDETQRMSQIINDFMEFNRSEKNGEFLIYKAVEEVKKMVIPQLKHKSIALEIDIDTDLKVFHNSKSIEHVLLNLITNAKDAFENKNDMRGKKIRIVTTIENDTALLSVEDNAGGIKKEIMNKIFNPYFTTKEQGKGTGIGLYMSKRMVEDVEGSCLSVKNIDSGAVFSITFKKEEEHKTLSITP
ncbi:MAG: PAS domain S-box protein [Sulfurimonas sp.]|jgi:hypothetical protein